MFNSQHLGGWLFNIDNKSLSNFRVTFYPVQNRAKARYESLLGQHLGGMARQKYRR